MDERSKGHSKLVYDKTRRTIVTVRTDIVDRLIAAARPEPRIKPTIEELEKILASEDAGKVELLPDGQVTVSSQWSELLLEAATEIKRLRIIRP